MNDLYTVGSITRSRVYGCSSSNAAKMIEQNECRKNADQAHTAHNVAVTYHSLHTKNNVGLRVL